MMFYDIEWLKIVSIFCKAFTIICKIYPFRSLILICLKKVDFPDWDAPSSKSVTVFLPFNIFRFPWRLKHEQIRNRVDPLNDIKFPFISSFKLTSKNTYHKIKFYFRRGLYFIEGNGFHVCCKRFMTFFKWFLKLFCLIFKIITFFKRSTDKIRCHIMVMSLDNAWF